MLGQVFQRFVQRRPLSVMVRGTLERVLGAEQLHQFYARTAHHQYTRALLCATVYELMSDVVFRRQPSVRAAYQAQSRAIATSLASVYNTLTGLETHTSAELVRYSAAPCTPMIEHVGGERAPWLDGYRMKIIDGTWIEASQRRLGVLRETHVAALPGKSLVVYAPAYGLATDVVPCEDGQAQERSVFKALFRSAQAGDLWSADRNFCTREFLADLDSHGAFCVIREHQGLPGALLRSLGVEHRLARGHVAAQQVRFVDAHGHVHRCRRLRLKLKEATRDGERLLSILTNVPRHTAATACVSELYRKRWTLETACKHIEAYCHSEIHTLGYPTAALFGFCLALVALQCAGGGVGGPAGRAWPRENRPRGVPLLRGQRNRHNLPRHDDCDPRARLGRVVHDEYARVGSDIGGASPPCPSRSFRKSPTRARKTRSTPKRSPKKGHVSTATLLKSRKAKAAVP